MSSNPTSLDDRSTAARIRDAAITCVAELGVGGATVREVAARAGVSPGLVMHHFRSVDGLRAACNDHVAAVIRDQKRLAMQAGPRTDVLSLLQAADSASTASIAGYLARVLAEDTAAVAGLVDELVHDAEEYLADGEASGMVQPTDDPRGRAVVLTIWSLGALVLHRHLDRLLGADPTRPRFAADPAVYAAYAGPAMQILGGGVFTDAFSAQLQQTLASVTEPRKGAER